jgi:hypothetical protein
MATTPISIIETYFERELNHSALKSFDRVTDDIWIDFAKHYHVQMKEHFANDFLQSPVEPATSLRLYFEPNLSHAWERTVTENYSRTPLLGLNPSPPSAETLTKVEISKLFSPLKKHLLLADSVYIRDSFYYSFDGVVEMVNRHKWRNDPNIVELVRESIQSIRNWLPILIEIRSFIESKAVVFMPYYITPSFPWRWESPNLLQYYEKIKLRDVPNTYENLNDSNTDLFKDEITAAWLNGRLLNLDPVFPNKAMSDWAARLYFDEGPGTTDLTSDLVSIQILPFGDLKDIGLDDLWRIHKNEEVFHNVKKIVADCKSHIENNMGPSPTKQSINALCRTFLQDNLQQYEKKSVLRFLNYVEQKPIAGFGWSIAVGLVFLPVNPVIGLFAGAVLNPQVVNAVRKRRNPTKRAYGHLQALI